MSIIKKRITLLFQSPEEIVDSLGKNDTHLIIKNQNKVFIQTRWRIINNNTEEDKSDSLVRITWKSTGSSSTDNHDGDIIYPSLNLLDPIINTGFNVYTNDSNITSLNHYPLIKTPKYNLLHSNTPLYDLFPSIFSGDELNLIDPSSFVPKNQFDILKDSYVTEINKYEVLEPNDLLFIQQNDNNNSSSSNSNNGDTAALSNTTISNLEVGLFYVDSLDDTDINLSGLRCLWNQTDIIQTCLKTSLFYKPFITKQKNNPFLNVQLEEPIGLHPNILIDLSNYHQINPNCQYYLFSQLPLELFVDKFQSDPIFVFGEHDLELPEYKLVQRSWGSEVLYQLEPGKVNKITLHSRYLNITTPYPSTLNVSFDPIVFKACDKNSLDIIKNPFYSKSLGLESFFTDDTNFNLLSSTTLSVPIPRPGYTDFNKIQLLTGITLLFSIIYLTWKVIPKRVPTRKYKHE